MCPPVKVRIVLATYPLGEVAGWPPSLRTVVRMCVEAATVQMAIWAGQELTLIYNQAYADLLGDTLGSGGWVYMDSSLTVGNLGLGPGVVRLSIDD